MSISLGSFPGALWHNCGRVYAHAVTDNNGGWDALILVTATQHVAPGVKRITHEGRGYGVTPYAAFCAARADIAPYVRYTAPVQMDLFREGGI